MSREKRNHAIRAAIKRVAFWCFWPALAVVGWGELTSAPPDAVEHVWDKALHFTAYLGLGGLAGLGWGRRQPAWRILLVVLAIGGALEAAQFFVGRDAEWADMAANALGAVIGLGAALLLLRLSPLVDALRRD